MKHRSSILVLAFLPVVSALALSNGPAIVTTGKNLVKDSSAPSPTSAPDNELRCRQELQRISLVGPDAICDYIEGNASQPWRCQPESSIRAFATATTNIAKSTHTITHGSVLCWGLTGCPGAAVPTTCVYKSRHDVKTACTGSCLRDQKILQCTSDTYIYCSKILFATHSLSNFFCSCHGVYAPMSVTTSITSQPGIVLTPSVQALPASSISSPSPSTSISPLTTSPSIQIKDTTASAIQPFGDGGKTSSAKGPIIGSIVGGSFGLVLIAAAVFFIYLRCKASRRG